MENEARCEGLVVTVGGSAAPIIFTLTQNRPSRVLFVVSHSSKAQVQNEILPALEEAPPADYCELTDENDIEEVYRDLQQGIAAWLRSTQVPPERVFVDFTGGTKPMSAGLSVAGMEFFSKFQYVSGGVRDKQGLGIVQSGTECSVVSSNPWNVQARRARERARWLYLAGLPGEAAEVLREAELRCAESMRSTLRAYINLLEFLESADRFAFRNLSHTVKRYRDLLEIMLFQQESKETQSAWSKLVEHWSLVETELKSQGPTLHTLREILSNADRRAHQSKWDDALARLYRATELWVQGMAYQAFGAPFGRVRLDHIPQGKRDAFRLHFGQPMGDGAYPLALKRLAEAVSMFSDLEQRHTLASTYEKLAPHLSKRNDSILAHGNRPASKEDFKAFRDELDSAIGASDLPTWPELRFGL